MRHQAFTNDKLKNNYSVLVHVNLQAVIVLAKLEV